MRRTIDDALSQNRKLYKGCRTTSILSWLGICWGLLNFVTEESFVDGWIFPIVSTRQYTTYRRPSVHSFQAALSIQQSSHSPTDTATVSFNTGNETRSELSYKLGSYLHHLRQTPNNLKAASSFLRYLKQQSTLPHDPLSTSDTIQLSRTAVFALRTAASANDYRYIVQLVPGIARYTQIDSRLLGEAIEALTMTSASLSKIKTLWNTYEPQVVLEARTINAYVRALVSRGKLKAALDTYYQYQTLHLTDAYTVTCLLKGLQDSLSQDHSRHTNTTLTLQHSTVTSDASSYLSLKTLSPTSLPRADNDVLWQWNCAMDLLENMHMHHPEHINNVVLSSIFQLNHKIAHMTEPQTLSLVMSTLAEQLWQWTQGHVTMELDAQTLSHVLSCLNATSAVHLLHALHHPPTASRWARPTAYTYGVVISVCLRSGQPELAWQLYAQDMTRYRISPTAVVINTALQALVQQQVVMAHANNSTTRQLRTWTKEQAQYMLQVYTTLGKSPSTVASDTVTFNLLLSGLSLAGKRLRESDWTEILSSYHPGNSTRLEIHDSSLPLTVDLLSLALLKRMNENRIPSDATTYRCALELQSGTNTTHVFSVLGQAEIDRLRSDERLSIVKAALTTFAKAGNTAGLYQLLAMPSSRQIISVDKDVASFLITAHTRAGDLTALPLLYRALCRDSDHMQLLHGNAVVSKSKSSLPSYHQFTDSIVACIQAKQYATARDILNISQENRIALPHVSLEKIARSYALSALQDTDFRNHKPHAQHQNVNQSDASVERLQVSAQFAYTLLVDGLHWNASDLSLATVCKACAATGLLDQSLALLRTLLQRITHSEYFDAKSLKVLSDLRQYLFRYFASTGDVNAALKFVSVIQKASEEYQGERNKMETTVVAQSCEAFVANHTPGTGNGIEMTSSNWKYLLIAAANSGHWRVCVSTLQFLQPTLEALNPAFAPTPSDRERFDQRYRQLSSCLSAATRCLALRSQYAWAVRVMNDWMDWTGRRPPLHAVFPTISILCARGRGDEVNRLLVRCTNIPRLENANDEESSKDYERSLYVGAISSLYEEGVQSSAEDALLAASTCGYIPLDMKWNNNTLVVDLHDMNLAMAHSCVRAAFKQEIFMNYLKKNGTWDSDMLVITGRGRNSKFNLRPVIRPEVQRMLVEDFYPPLSTVSIPGNMGALRVPSNDIAAWLNHQETMKGAKILSVAAALKTLSSGNRLKAALTRKAKDNPTTGNSQ
jgi:pentatricopeptide repeat protein